MFIESMIGADAESVAHPIVEAPVVEHFVGDKEGELHLIDFERMLELHAVAIAPGINLRVAPAALKRIAVDQRELAERKTQRRSQRGSLFGLVFSIWRCGFAMKIRWAKAEIPVYLENESDSPALIDRPSDVIADPQSSLKHKIDFLLQRHGKLNIIPVLCVGFGNLAGRLRARHPGHPHQDRNKTQ